MIGMAEDRVRAPRALVAVTGCIAAYKACEVVRGLQKAGCEVRVAMTEAATAFVGPLTFEAPDEARFPCLRLAREALRAGPYAMIALNGANEAAVAAFLENRIPFGAIANIVEQILASTLPERISCVEDVYRMDKDARLRATEEIGRME